MPRSLKSSLRLSFFFRIKSCTNYHLPTECYVLCVYVTLSGFISLMVFDEEYKLWSYMQCVCSIPPVAFSLLGPNVLLSILFSGALVSSLPLMRDVKFHTQHSKATRKIVLLDILFVCTRI
jgi:hypothetical protein